MGLKLLCTGQRTLQRPDEKMMISTTLGAREIWLWILALVLIQHLLSHHQSLVYVSGIRRIGGRGI